MRALHATLALALAAAACGPVGYVSQVTRAASTTVVAAKEAQADKWAPYEFTLATQYLEEARRQAGHANFEIANRFGRIAERAAKLAVQLSEARSKDPDKARAALPPAQLVDPDLAPLDGEGLQPGRNKDAP